jgi:PAS domain S-box-containing protein
MPAEMAIEPVSESSNWDLSQFFFVSTDLMCIVGYDGYFKKINPAFIEKLGYSEAEILSTPYLQFVHPDDLEITIQEASRLSDGKQSTISFENRFVCKNGSHCHLSWNTSPIGSALLSIGRDVTIQRKADMELARARTELIRREAEEKFRETFEHAGLGLIHLSPNYHITAVNQEFCNILGYTRDELIGRDITSLYAYNFPIGLDQDAEHLRNGTVQKLVREFQYRKKDKSVIWLLLSDSAVRDASGEIKYFIVAAKDIAVRKQMEESLQKSEESFRCVAESIPQIVWTSDPSGQIDYFSQNWYDYTGLPISTSFADGWTRGVHPEDLESCLTRWSEALKIGQSYEAEYRFMAKNGNYRWLLCRALPLRDRGDQIIKWFGTFTDIDEQKIIQQELELSLSELKNTSEEKSRLIASEKAALEASRLKSEFLANMSHEIRTPLNAVIGMSELLLDTHLSKEQKDYADTIVQSADSLLSTVNDILDLSKIEAGKMDIETHDIDLMEVLESVRRVMLYSALQKGIELIIHSDAQTIHWVRGDGGRLRQLLFNLVQNAVKFTERGSVRLNVQLTGQKTNGIERIRFEVIDTGIGIDSDSQKKIFSAFIQADTSTTRRYGGSGLGLSICKRLVELMNGSLGVESQPGAGSKFWFEVPLEKIQSPQPENKPRSAYEKPKTGKTFRILVAEDNAINQKVIKRLLKSLGFQADFVTTGKQALTRLKKVNYHLIFMDCHMPEMDGFTATQNIRSAKNKKSTVPIVALTANVLNGTKEKCMDAGMTDYICKPVALNELRRVLETYLTTHSKAGQPTPPIITNNQIIELKTLEKLDSVGSTDTSDFISELIADFNRTTPLKIQNIRNAFAAEEYKLGSDAAHELKSVSAILGAKQLEIICATLEKITKASLADRLPVLLKNLEHAYLAASEGLEAIRVQRLSLFKSIPVSHRKKRKSSTLKRGRTR